MLEVQTQLRLSKHIKLGGNLTHVDGAQLLDGDGKNCIRQASAFHTQILVVKIVMI